MDGDKVLIVAAFKAGTTATSRHATGRAWSNGRR
jgi:hypothetical protein